jgi:glutamyl-tRNA synthetase
MPVRVLLTGGMKGPEVGAILALVRQGESSGAVTEKAGLVTLDERIKILREVDWASVTSKLAESVSQETEPALSH